MNERPYCGKRLPKDSTYHLKLSLFSLGISLTRSDFKAWEEGIEGRREEGSRGQCGSLVMLSKTAPLTSCWSWRARKEGAVRTLPTSSWMMPGLLSYMWMVHALSSRTTTGTWPPLASSCAPRPWSRPWALCCVREKLEEKTWARWWEGW